MAQWYFKKNNQKVGPLNDTQMRQVARDGILGSSDPVWRDGLKEWVPASRIKGLFPAAEGLSAMATIQEPVHHPVMPAKQPVPPPRAAPVKPTGQGPAVVEVFDLSQVQAASLPTVLAKPIGGGHKVTISQPQRTAPQQQPQPAPPASAEKPYEPPPLPPDEKPAAPPTAKPVVPHAAQAAPVEPKPPEAPTEEEPVNVEQDEEDDFLAGVKDETPSAKAARAAEESARPEAGEDIEQAVGKEPHEADQVELAEQAEPAAPENEIFASEAKKPRPSEKKPAAAKSEPASEPSPEPPDQQALPGKPGICLALAACTIGLLSAAPAGAVLWFAIQGDAAAYPGAADSAGRSVLEHYRAAVGRELSGGFDAALTDWRVLIGLAGLLTLLLGLLALLAAPLRKTAAAIFILLALAGLAGHVAVFQAPVVRAPAGEAKAVQPGSPRLTPQSRSAPQPPIKVRPATAPASTPGAAPAPASQPQPASGPL